MCLWGKKMKKFLVERHFYGAVFAFCFIELGAGAKVTTGTVQGDVLDEKGSSVPGASVEAKISIRITFARKLRMAMAIFAS